MALSMECVLAIHALHMVVFVFFFQAEDGIRDTSVTGVQTCALPIYADCFSPCSWPLSRPSPRRPARHFREAAPSAKGSRRRRSSTSSTRLIPQSTGRSEERRVGKECRARWGPAARKKGGPHRTADED